MGEKIAELEKDLERSKEEKANLRDKVDEIRKSSQKEISTLQATASGNKSNDGKLQGRVRELEQQNDEYENKSRMAAMDLQSAQEKLEPALEQNAMYKMELEELQDAKAHLEQELKEVESEVEVLKQRAPGSL